MLKGALRINVIQCRNICKSKQISFSTINSTILHRDVFIYDHSFPLKSWITAHQKGSSTKHPSSGHVIAAYSSYIHNNSKYHFNSLGEFSLIFSSVLPLPHDNILTADIEVKVDCLPPKNEKNSIAKINSHSIFIYPDGLHISGLSVNEIPTIVDLILKDKNIEKDHLNKILPDYCTLSEFPKLMVIASSSKHQSMEKAAQILNWFRSAIIEKTEVTEVNKSDLGSSIPDLGSEIPDRKSSTVFFLASELGGHRNSSSVILLPSEDSFEFVSTEESVLKIIKNCNILKP